MKAKANKETIIRIATIVISLVLLFASNRAITGGEKLFGRLSVAPVYPATADLILATSWTDPETKTEAHVFFEATITSGDKKGESVIVRQILSSAYVANNKIVEVNDRVIIRYTDYGQSKIWMLQQYNRTPYILGLLGLFILLLFIFGGKKGFYTLIALVLTFMCLFLYFLPSILMGHNIYIAAFITSLFIMSVTLLLVNGISAKTLSAAVGTLGGILTSGIIFGIMDNLLQLTGIVDEEASYLLVMNSSIQLKGIMFAATIISALGASLDVGVSIASSLDEIYSGKKAGFSEIFKSGINIGQDIIATMTNTLILVYVGSALSGTLLLIAYSNSLLELFNRERIIFEILQAIIGSIGVLFAIPITSAFYSIILRISAKRKKSKPKKEEPPLEPKEIIANEMPEHLKE